MVNSECILYSLMWNRAISPSRSKAPHPDRLRRRSRSFASAFCFKNGRRRRPIISPQERGEVSIEQVTLPSSLSGEAKHIPRMPPCSLAPLLRGAGGGEGQAAG